MLVGTLILLFFVPALFVIFQTLEEKFKPVQFEETQDNQIDYEIEGVREQKRAKGEHDNTVKF